MLPEVDASMKVDDDHMCNIISAFVISKTLIDKHLITNSDTRKVSMKKKEEAWAFKMTMILQFSHLETSEQYSFSFLL